MTPVDIHRQLGVRLQRAGLSVAPKALAQLEAYYRLLARWNRRFNLAGFALDAGAPDAVDRLLVEPVAASRFVGDPGQVWVDLGSGGGSPAIPLRIVRPAAKLVMVESKARKAAFLREVIRALELNGVSVEERRFEEFSSSSAMTGSADLTTVRAVRVDGKLYDTALALLRTGGRLFLFGASDVADPPEGFEREGHHKRLGAAGSSLQVLLRCG
jgi:16S rRNA (guanine527-N7)-methyltransferase